MDNIAFFTKDDGRKLPVSDDFLLPFLNPASPGTQYWEGPPKGTVLERQRGRIVLQVHQILSLLQQCGVDLKGKSLCDIGTGNGMVPRLMLEFSDLGSAVGADPYLSDEHKTSWQAHDDDALFRELRDFILECSPGKLDYATYRDLLGFEHHTMRPCPVPYSAQAGKAYRFAQIGAHDLAQLDERFDVFYVKALDHIPDWQGIFKAVNAVAKPGAWFLIKHFSFFSYLGPHRYASTNIPWGHLLMTDGEYRRFANEFHAHRAEQMVDFYFTGLSYPRTPMNDLIRIAQDSGFIPQVVINEPLRNIAQFHSMTHKVDNFWQLIREMQPGLSAEEMFSGRYHVLLHKVA
jgi:hypothetical protein